MHSPRTASISRRPARVLKISRSGYYEWRSRPVSAREQDNELRQSLRLPPNGSLGTITRGCPPGVGIAHHWSSSKPSGKADPSNSRQQRDTRSGLRQSRGGPIFDNSIAEHPGSAVRRQRLGPARRADFRRDWRCWGRRRLAGAFVVSGVCGPLAGQGAAYCNVDGLCSILSRCVSWRHGSLGYWRRGGRWPSGPSRATSLVRPTA